MAREGEDPPRALGLQDIGCLAEGACRVDHVVDYDAVAVGDIAYKVHGVDCAGAGALLDDHGEANVGAEVELGGEALEGGGRGGRGRANKYNDNTMEAGTGAMWDE